MVVVMSAVAGAAITKEWRRAGQRENEPRGAGPWSRAADFNPYLAVDRAATMVVTHDPGDVVARLA